MEILLPLFVCFCSKRGDPLHLTTICAVVFFKTRHKTIKIMIYIGSGLDGERVIRKTSCIRKFFETKDTDREDAHWVLHMIE